MEAGAEFFDGHDGIGFRYSKSSGCFVRFSVPLTGTHTCALKHIHTHARSNIYTHTRAHRNTNTHTCAQTHIHTQFNKYTHTHTHTHKHTHEMIDPPRHSPSKTRATSVSSGTSFLIHDYFRTEAKINWTCLHQEVLRERERPVNRLEP